MSAHPDGAVPADELPHPGGGAEEWIFAVWSPDARAAAISGHRLLRAEDGVRRRAWYWAAYALADGPLFHVTEFDVMVRPDPFVVKAEALWAEHTCDAPWEQWTIGNETYAAAIDDADDALGRAYGVPTPIAFDLEWYATAPPFPSPDVGVTAAPGRSRRVRAYEQPGVAHGVVEIAGRPADEFVEAPAHRWRRWVEPGDDSTDGSPDDLGPVPLPAARAHTGVRVPVALPDGTVLDWVLTAQGWCSRRR